MQRLTAKIPTNAHWTIHCAKRVTDVLTAHLVQNKGEAVADQCFFPLTWNHIGRIIEDFERAHQDGRLAALLAGNGSGASAVVSAVPLDEGPSRIHAILETGNFRVKDVAKKLGVPEATVRAMIALDGSGLELNAQGWVKSLVEA